jgi:hypothetical protein
MITHSIISTYGWMRGYGCAGHGREHGTIVSMWARPGVPAFGRKYVTVWNGWDGHTLSTAISLFRKVEPSGARAEKRGRLPEYHG